MARLLMYDVLDRL